MGDIRQQQPADSPDPYARYAEGIGTTWPPSLPFEEVLQRAKADYQPAIAMLYHRFLPAVYRYILARVADVATAEDLTSDTFLAMIRGISTARAQDELGFAAWLLGIARNRVLMHFRQIKIHPEVELQPQHVDLSQSIAEEDDPLLVLMARELWSETTDALRRLTPEQQMVVYYRCVLGYSTEEVADLMARRPGTIRALQFRALASLARLLNAGNGTEKPERRRHHAG